MARGLFILLSLLLAGLTLPAAAAIDLQRPGDREFVRDQADLITPADEQAIQQIADKLLTDRATPIIVLTIKSMAEHGGADMRIETFANLLFDQWGIGYEKLNKQQWNTGILLLVSKQDRKARIELGAGWSHEKDELCQRIMDEQIIPRFKQGDFTGGIRAAVVALDAMAREKELPKPPTDWRKVLLVLAVIALAVFTAVSLVRRGSSGWAWLLWAAVFGVIGMILYSMLRSRGSSGGGFGGGSFGGGFSGGGGASGSW